MKTNTNFTELPNEEQDESSAVKSNPGSFTVEQQKRIVCFNMEEYQHKEYLSFDQISKIKQSIGLIKWAQLKAIGKIELEAAEILGLSELKGIYLLRNSSGMWLDYVHGFKEKQYFIKPNVIKG